MPPLLYQRPAMLVLREYVARKLHSAIVVLAYAPLLYSQCSHLFVD